MFTGIIEAIGEVQGVEPRGANVDFTITSALAPELKVDQSVSHNGTCLTVTQVFPDAYRVTAVQETLSKTNLGRWRRGTLVNLERSMPMNGRFDGHIVQGHVDQTGTCTAVTEADGSWLFDFSYNPAGGNMTVEKGSICVNGVSLTVFNTRPDAFRVAIIPYTFAHTNFQQLKPGDLVNLEFDIIGKYLAALFHQQQSGRRSSS